MLAKTDKKHHGSIGSLVGAGTLVSGDLLFSGGLRIDGEVRGNVRVAEGQSGTLVIGEQGSIEGHIEVDHLVVHGLVVGRVDARQSVTLHATARLKCDLTYARAEIHLGAMIQGRLLQWGQESVEPPAPLLLGKTA